MFQYRRNKTDPTLLAKGIEANEGRLARLEKQLQAFSAPQNAQGSETEPAAGGGGGNVYAATLGAALSAGSTASATLTHGPDGVTSGSVTASDALLLLIQSGKSIDSGATVLLAKFGETYAVIGWNCDDQS